MLINVHCFYKKLLLQPCPAFTTLDLFQAYQQQLDLEPVISHQYSPWCVSVHTFTLSHTELHQHLHNFRASLSDVLIFIASTMEWHAQNLENLEEVFQFGDQINLDFEFGRPNASAWPIVVIVYLN